MAVTFNIAKCKKGYGVYVRALSGFHLDHLRWKFPGITPDTTVIHTKSDRIARKRNKLAAKRYINKLKESPDILSLLDRLFIKEIPKESIIVKLQYYRLNRKINGYYIKQVQSFNISYIQSLSLEYAETGINTTISKAFKRYHKIHPTELDELGNISTIL